MQLTDATIADYFCKGIETSMLLPERARAWADAMIADSDEPPYAFIEISLSNGVPELISALRGLPGDRDSCSVGTWLLAELQQVDVDSVAGLEAAIRKAMLVCKHCAMADAVYYEFDAIDDALHLARHGHYGTVHGCRADLLASLQRHAKPFPGAGKAQPITPADGIRPPLS
jgi:hypothetical protein